LFDRLAREHAGHACGIKRLAARRQPGEQEWQMAEEEYEIAGLHEKLLEEEAEKGQLAQKIALLTAILATIGAVFSYQSGAKQNEALFLKNQSILKQSEASDAWGYYQAKSTKAHLDQLALVLVTDPAQKARFRRILQKQQTQQAEQLKSFRPCRKSRVS
jgi:hypothetical protein